MSQDVFVHGLGAVSPAGWNVPALREALQRNEALPVLALQRPGWSRPLQVRQVPPMPPPRPAFLGHARLRRTSPITHYTVSAALEALGPDQALVTGGKLRLGIILCVLSGCVNYSRRFYDETLRDPATASPLVFPETVFNAPSSHIASLLGAQGINYTLVGDPGCFLQGMALAADWLLSGQVEACLVIGAEEMDWLTADAFRLFQRSLRISDGSGALYLKTVPAPVRLAALTDSFLFTPSRTEAAQKMRAQLPPAQPNHLLCEGTQQLPRLDAAEREAWQDWTQARLAPKTILGEGLMAASAWQCVAAVDQLQQGAHKAASVSVVGCNHQAIGAHFVKGGS